MKKIVTPNDIVNIKSKVTDSNIELSNTEGIFAETYYFTDFFDDKKLKRFIKGCERMIRSSNEYKTYIGFLKNTVGLKNCSVLGYIDHDNAIIEFHHYPFTLYDIVQLCVNKHILEEKPFNTFIISRQVLLDHYDNIIGVTPLSTTVHELVHAKQIFVSLNQVYGDLNEFINKYYVALTDEEIENYNELVEMTRADVTYSEDDVLKTRDVINDSY